MTLKSNNINYLHDSYHQLSWLGYLNQWSEPIVRSKFLYGGGGRAGVVDGEGVRVKDAWSGGRGKVIKESFQKQLKIRGG